MSPAHGHHRKAVKLRRAGRHTAPSQAEKVAGKAVQAAPAMAVTAGTLMGVPHGHAAAPAVHATAIEAAVIQKAAPAAVAAGSTYTVRPGDTLSGISRQFYGTAGNWQGLYHANKAAVPSPDLIYPGEKLTVPSHPAAGPAPATRKTSAASRGSSYQARHATAGPAAPGVPASFQSCVIRRESGGNARAVNPDSGAGGLFQFLPSTWHGLGYAGLPEDAPVQTQFEAFARLYAQAGSSPWRPSDGCA